MQCGIDKFEYDRGAEMLPSALPSWRDIPKSSSVLWVTADREYVEGELAVHLPDNRQLDRATRLRPALQALQDSMRQPILRPPAGAFDAAEEPDAAVSDSRDVGALQKGAGLPASLLIAVPSSSVRERLKLSRKGRGTPC